MRAAARFTTGAATTERSSIRCAGGLTGRQVSVSDLSATVIDVLVRLQRADGTTQVVRRTPAAPAFVVEDAPRWTAIAATYLGLGVEHILLGIDHLLFVLAMLLLVRSFGRLVATITAFTVAHSITLALATLGLVHLPPQPVEAAIALSIVRGGGDRSWPHGAAGPERSLALGPSPSSSACCTGRGSRVRCARSGCRKRHSGRPAVLQSRRGARPARLCRRRAGGRS